MFANLNKKFKESLFSVFPIVLIIMAISIFIIGLPWPIVVKFAISSVLLFFGMSVFSLGADTAMIPIGQHVSSSLTKSKKIWLLIFACLIMGMVITVAEPDVSVLANQIPSLNRWVFISAVGFGVGICFVLGVIRILFKIPFKTILIVGYSICFLLFICVPKSFWAVAFDASGVTTGAISVPFIMSFGLGISAIRSDKNNEADSFGMVAICSIGPILSVLILGLFSKGITSPEISTAIETSWSSIPQDFFVSFKTSFLDSAFVILPILAIFLVFQFATIRLARGQILKIVVGLVFTYFGISVFMTGVNAGFSELGVLIGKNLSSGETSWIVYPLAIVLGYVVVAAEPSVQVLTKQVAEISENTISKRTLRVCLSVGVAISMLIAVLRAQFEINILYFLLPIFGLSIAISFYNPQIFTTVAFDSGGISSGIMSASFLLPFVEGVAVAFGSDTMIGAFGTVALISATPILVVQILGAIAKTTKKKRIVISTPVVTGRITVVDFDF